MIAIEAKKIDFYYNTTRVINDVSMSLKQSAFLGIIGPNGAGKSTMLRLLCGILKPNQGAVLLFGENLSNQSHKIIAQQIAFVPQETHFALDFPVNEIVRMGRYPYKRPFQREDSADHYAVEYALQAANLEGLHKRPINSLSSGERQRVVIARALAQSPRILLLDEPTSHLDLHHQFAIMELLKKLNADGISIAVVHHDLNLASLYCHHLVLMHGGRIYTEGRPNDLLNEKTLKDVYGAEVKIVRHPDKDVPQIFLHTEAGHEDTDR
jgi:iron complex transport system ATP-binding protein